MPGFSLGLTLVALSGTGAPPADLAPGDKTVRLVDYLREYFPFQFKDQSEPLDPVTLLDDPNAPLISLSDISDPRALERQLRELVTAPYATIRINVPSGQAHVGNFSVGSTDSVPSDLLVVQGKADVYGRVRGNVVALDGDVLVHRGAVIEGDAFSFGGTVVNLGGTVLGQSLALDREPVLAASAAGPVARTATNLAGVIGSFLTLGILGFGLVLFGKSNLEVVSDTVSHSFLRSFIVGLLAQVLVVPTFGMLVVGLVLSVVGVLLVPFVIAVYLLLVLAGVLGGFLAVSHAMGETHTRRRMARGDALSPNSYRYLLVGLGAVASVWLAWVGFGWVPVAGTLVLGAAVIATWLLGTVGLGAAVLSRGGIQPSFAGRYLPTEMLTDEYLWATPQQGVPAVKRPTPKP